MYRMTKHCHPYLWIHRVSCYCQREEEDEEEDIKDQESTSYSFEDIVRGLPRHQEE